jgi:hypothetical protein
MRRTNGILLQKCDLRVFTDFRTKTEFSDLRVGKGVSKSNFLRFLFGNAPWHRHCLKASSIDVSPGQVSMSKMNFHREFSLSAPVNKEYLRPTAPAVHGVVGHFVE